MPPPPDGPQLEAGAALDVPLWLAPELVKRRMLELEMPSMFNQRVRSQLDAGPGPFDLRARSPHWYEVGSRLNSLVADPVPDADGSVGALVLETFLGRYRWAPAPSALGGALPPGARASSPCATDSLPPPLRLSRSASVVRNAWKALVDTSVSADVQHMTNEERILFTLARISVLSHESWQLKPKEVATKEPHPKRQRR